MTFGIAPVVSMADIASAIAMAGPNGLKIEYLTTTTFRVRAGTFRTRNGRQRLILAADTTIDIATAGSAGMDRKTLTGTVSGTAGTKAITGTGTAFFTEFGVRALTGTFGNGGGTTTITAVGGDPIADRVCPGDLVGNTAIGYRRVTARNFSLGAIYTLTVSTAHASFSGATINVIENPTFSFAAERHAVDQIASNTGLTIIDNMSGSPSGAAAYTGDRYPYRLFYVWLLGDGTLRASTQRTTPFAPDVARRIGAAPLEASGLLPVQQWVWGRSGNKFRFVVPAQASVFTTSTTYARLAEYASGNAVFVADATERLIAASITSNSGATNGARVGLALTSDTAGGSQPRILTLYAGDVDNAEHGSAGQLQTWYTDPYGDGSYYGAVFYDTGSGGSLAGGLSIMGAEIEL